MKSRLYVLCVMVLYFSSVVLLAVVLTWTGIVMFHSEYVEYTSIWAFILAVTFWTFTATMSIAAWIKLWRNVREHIREFERERSRVHSCGYVV